MIVVEGATDIETYRNLLTRYGVPKEEFALFSAHGKGFVLNASTWNSIRYSGTDLLSAYGFPVEGQAEYSQFVDIIKQSSNSWQISQHRDGKQWWEENQKAKLDKFIYSALSHGFEVSQETPNLPQEPTIIKNIKSIICAS
jgi:hypothetical protein